MEEPKITSGTVPYIASEIPDDPRDITPEQWEAMKAVDIRTVDKSQLVDLSTVHIDESLPVRERVLSYLKQVKNPYCVRVGNFAVKVKYKEDGPSFEEVFKHLLQQQNIIDQELYDMLSARPLGVQPRGGVISPQRSEERR